MLRAYPEGSGVALAAYVQRSAVVASLSVQATFRNVAIALRDAVVHAYMTAKLLTSSNAPYRSDSSAEGVSELMGSEMRTVGLSSVSWTLRQQIQNVTS